MDKYRPVIGLEIHAELSSQRKMFCGCLNNSDETKPNANVCPVCLAHPGTLPVANRKPIEMMIKIGVAVGGRIAEQARFYRKNYFYPDLPKGYQITSQPEPFVIGGSLRVGGREIKIDHIHLEEDTGTLIHDKSDKHTLVDFNRAGVPLMELVTEPVIESGIEARRFAEELQLLLRYLGVAEANMEKGEMRCEVNISLTAVSEIAERRGQNADLREKEQKKVKLGTKVEIKNLNSFRAVEKAVEFEVGRQSKVLEAGEKVIQETRGWDESKGETVSQRRKEEAHDYRYFPEPDLPPFRLADFGVEAIKENIPELPAEKRERLQKEYDLSGGQAETLVADIKLVEFYERAVSEFEADERGVPYGIIYNYLVSDLRGLMKSEGIGFKTLKVTPENFADLTAMVAKGEIGSRVAKDVLKEMFMQGADPEAIIKERGLTQVGDEEQLREAVKKVISGNEKVVGDYKKGKKAAIKFLVGQAMKETRGRGEPKMIEKLLEEELGK